MDTSWYGRGDEDVLPPNHWATSSHSSAASGAAATHATCSPLRRVSNVTSVKGAGRGRVAGRGGATHPVAGKGRLTLRLRRTARGCLAECCLCRARRRTEWAALPSAPEVAAKSDGPVGRARDVPSSGPTPQSGSVTPTLHWWHKSTTTSLPGGGSKRRRAPDTCPCPTTTVHPAKV